MAEQNVVSEYGVDRKVVVLVHATMTVDLLVRLVYSLFYSSFCKLTTPIDRDLVSLVARIILWVSTSLVFVVEFLKSFVSKHIIIIAL